MAIGKPRATNDKITLGVPYSKDIAGGKVGALGICRDIKRGKIEALGIPRLPKKGIMGSLASQKKEYSYVTVLVPKDP